MPIANELGCSLAQLAMAWCLKNPNVSTVITGASRAEQVHENMKALEVVPKLTPEVMGAGIEGVLNGKPDEKICVKSRQPGGISRPRRARYVGA